MMIEFTWYRCHWKRRRGYTKRDERNWNNYELYRSRNRIGL